MTSGGTSFRGLGASTPGAVTWLLIAVVTVLAASACKCQTGAEVGRIDERGAATWAIDEGPVAVQKTYFQARGADVAFVVEWTFPGRTFSRPMSEAEAEEISRPVLRHAVETKEVSRTRVVRVGTTDGRVTRLVSRVTYDLGGSPQIAEVSVTNLDTLFVWTWRLDGKSFRIFGPGYYLNTDNDQLYFTVKWHDQSLCEGIDDLTDATAAGLAMPLMWEIERRQLFTRVPRIGPPGTPKTFGTKAVDAVGIEMGCPRSDCAGDPACPVRGRRVVRTLKEIREAH